MRAKLSAGSEMAGWVPQTCLMEEWADRRACDEARAILTEVEPVDPWGRDCSGYATLHSEAHAADGSACVEYLALADALRAFVDGN